MDMCLFELGASWQNALENELKKPYIASLAAFVEKERASGVPIYPPKELTFNAFKLTPYNKVKVLIMGQDPYHGPGQAHGLSFSVPNGIPMPPSLQNIYKELVADVGVTPPSNGCLLPWAEQGVMLLNATLTVRHSDAMSHHGKGWEQFTDAVVAKLNDREDPVIFVLWGKSAQEKCRIVNQSHKRHYVLTSSHPSPFSAHQGFLGSRHFSKINELLITLGKDPIKWQVS